MKDNTMKERMEYPDGEVQAMARVEADEMALTERQRAEEEAFLEQKERVDRELAEMDAKEREKNPNIFSVMKAKYEAYRDENQWKRQEKQRLKQEYEQKLAAARRDRYIQEQEQKYRDKMAWQTLSTKDRLAKTQEKFKAFGEKMQGALGQPSGGGGGFNVNAGVERMLGKPSTGSARSMSGASDLMSSDRVSRMLGSGAGSSDASRLGVNVRTENIRQLVGASSTTGGLSSGMGFSGEKIKSLASSGARSGSLPSESLLFDSNRLISLAGTKTAQPELKGKGRMRKGLAQPSQEEKIKRIIGF